MKAKRFFMGMMLALCLAAPAVASGLGDIRVNARFLTDRMAFELNLTQTQYNDLYEVNYDFFSGIDPYVSAMARQEAYALDAYYRYLDDLYNNNVVRISSSSCAVNRTYKTSSVCNASPGGETKTGGNCRPLSLKQLQGWRMRTQPPLGIMKYQHLESYWYRLNKG